MLGKDWKHRLKGSFGIESTTCWHRIFRVLIMRYSPSFFVHPLYSDSINGKSSSLNNPLLSFASPISLQMHCAFCFITCLDYCIALVIFSLFIRNLLTTRKLWSLEHKDEKLCFIHKGLNKNGFRFQGRKMRYNEIDKHRGRNIF